jgi:hypothetical protein
VGGVAHALGAAEGAEDKEEEEEEEEELNYAVLIGRLGQLPRLDSLELSDWPLQVRSDFEALVLGAGSLSRLTISLPRKVRLESLSLSLPLSRFINLNSDFEALVLGAGSLSRLTISLPRTVRLQALQGLAHAGFSLCHTERERERERER